MRRLCLLYGVLALSQWTGCGGCHDEEISKASVFFQKGLQLEREGNFSSAADEYRRAIELYPDYVEAHFQLGNLYEKLGIPDQAQRQYEKTIGIDSKHSHAYNNLGNVFGQQGKLDDAIAAYRNAIQIDPSLAAAHYNLGHSLMLKRQLSEAEQELKAAAELSPDPKYHKAIGQLYVTQGRFQEALPYLEKAHKDNWQDQEIYYPLAEAYEKTLRFDEAIAVLQTYSEIVPDMEEKMIARTRIRGLKMQKTDLHAKNQRRTSIR